MAPSRRDRPPEVEKSLGEQWVVAVQKLAAGWSVAVRLPMIFISRVHSQTRVKNYRIRRYLESLRKTTTIRSSLPICGTFYARQRRNQRRTAKNPPEHSLPASSHLPLQLQHPVQQRLGRRRAPRDVDVHRNNPCTQSASLCSSTAPPTVTPPHNRIRVVVVASAVRT